MAATSLGGTVGLPNYGYGIERSEPLRLHRSEKHQRLDLCAYTNGVNMENYDQQGIQLEAEWDVSDTLSVKYIWPQPVSLPAYNR